MNCDISLNIYMNYVSTVVKKTSVVLQTERIAENKHKEGYFAAEFVYFEIDYPCFIKAVIPTLNFTAMNFLGHNKTCQTSFGMQWNLSVCNP